MNEEKVLGAIFKPKALASKYRKRNPSIDSEWDFSRCPPEETSECLFWEYTREIPSIKQWIKGLRSSCVETTFDGFFQAYNSQTAGMWNLEKLPRTFAARFYFAPEWPNSAYLSVDVKERRRRMIYQRDTAIKVPNPIQNTFWPILARRYLERDFLENLERAIRETGKPTVPYYIANTKTNVTDAIFNINWNYSDIWLKKRFAEWIQENRPKGTYATRRGEGQSSIKTHQTALRNLVAWRLLGKHRLKSEVAEELTRKNGKPLYSGQDNWIAAKREAEKRLQSMANFAAGRS